VNSLLKTATRQRRDCDLNPGPSASESSTPEGDVNHIPDGRLPLLSAISDFVKKDSATEPP